VKSVLIIQDFFGTPRTGSRGVARIWGGGGAIPEGEGSNLHRCPPPPPTPFNYCAFVRHHGYSCVSRYTTLCGTCRRPSPSISALWSRQWSGLGSSACVAAPTGLLSQGGYTVYCLNFCKLAFDFISGGILFHSVWTNVSSCLVLIYLDICGGCHQTVLFPWLPVLRSKSSSGLTLSWPWINLNVCNNSAFIRLLSKVYKPSSLHFSS